MPPTTRTEFALLGVDDVPVFAHLFDAYRGFYGAVANPDGAERFLVDRLSRGESVLIGARVNGEAAGFVQLYPGWSSIRMAPVYVLNDLFVHPNHRGLGLGAALVREAETTARARGVHRLVLETQTENRGAQALYRRLGWTQESGFLTFARELPED